MTIGQNNKFQNKILKTISKCSHNQEIKKNSGHYRHYHHHHHRIINLNEINSPPPPFDVELTQISSITSPSSSSTTSSQLLNSFKQQKQHNYTTSFSSSLNTTNTSNFLPFSQSTKFNYNKILKKRKTTATPRYRNMLQLNSNLFFGLAIFFVTISIGSGGGHNSVALLDGGGSSGGSSNGSGGSTGTTTTNNHHNHDSESLSGHHILDYSNLTHYIKKIDGDSIISSSDRSHSSGANTGSESDRRSGNSNNIIRDEIEFFDGFETYDESNNNIHRFETVNQQPIYQNEFAVYIPNGDLAADAVAAKHGFINMGPVSDFIFISIDLTIFKTRKKKSIGLFSVWIIFD